MVVFHKLLAWSSRVYRTECVSVVVMHGLVSVSSTGLDQKRQNFSVIYLSSLSNLI